MSPAPIRILNVEPGEPSTSTCTREAETMHIQSTLHYRSARRLDGGNGVDGNTIIFIVIGVVCLFVILIGFYLVSRPRAAHNAPPNSPSQHAEHSPIAHPPPLRLQRERDMSQCWKIWTIWRHTGTANPATPGAPVSQVSPAPATIINPAPAVLSDSKTPPPPPSPSRPEQSRRVTSLSVTTSFSHSHITEEALNDFRASAYDLDGDLETEMLNSARDEFWWGHPFAVEEGCGGMSIVCMEEDAAEAGRNVSATPNVGGAEFGGDSPPKIVTTECGGGDYENVGSCHRLASGCDGVEADMEKQSQC